MICFRDYTYCGSPHCTNKCGRKMSEEIKDAARRSGLPVSYAMFCEQVSSETLQTHIDQEYSTVKD